MTRNPPRLLIVGLGGLVGPAMLAYALGHGWSVVTASHRQGADTCVDLMRTIPSRLASAVGHCDYAVICAGLTGFDFCRKEEKLSRRANVDNTIRLLEMLMEAGVRPIFCSSDGVFKGDRGDYHVLDVREPATEYGRQKKAVEDFLLKRQQPWSILRLSKLYGLTAEDSSPIGTTLRALREGGRVRAAVDQVVVPTCVDDVAQFVGLLVRRELTGIFHITAEERFSRYSLAMFLAKSLGAERLVEVCSIADFNFKEVRPTNTSMSSKETIERTGFRCAELRENCEKVFRVHFGSAASGPITRREQGT